jgi:hypothetical protein
MSESSQKSIRVSAIVPARNEQAVIGACIESLAPQPGIDEILVIDDQSTDQTAAVVRQQMVKLPKLRLMQTAKLPAGWVGKNYAVWSGAREAKGKWLLFTDADAVHNVDSAAQALAIASQKNVVMVSFSPEQVMETWYEKALIPYVYCRLASKFSFDNVNDPGKPAAAANGQFLLIRHDVYDAVGGHSSVASDVLEDVALARHVKSAGYPIWFGSGKGVVRVRMYRTFAAMWEGWKKNLFPLMGGSAEATGKEILRAVVPVLATFIAAVAAWGLTDSRAAGLGVLALGLVGISIAYDGELRRNQFQTRLGWFGIPGTLLFAAVLRASYRSHQQGKLEWKGREYPVDTPRASN